MSTDRGSEWGPEVAYSRAILHLAEQLPIEDQISLALDLERFAAGWKRHVLVNLPAWSMAIERERRRESRGTEPGH